MVSLKVELIGIGVLFKSEDKFDSGSGWPSFDDAIEGNVKEIPDNDGRRVEIVCKTCDGHLGHVFNDGPTPTGERYCVNAASIDFAKEEN